MVTSSSLSLVACIAEVHSGEPWRLKAGLTIHTPATASELLTLYRATLQRYNTAL